MKITIAPSVDRPEYKHSTVTVDTGYGDDILGDAMNQIALALVAYGYHQTSINEWVLDKAAELDEQAACEPGVDKEHYL